MDPGDIDRLIAGRLKPACATCGRTDWRVFGNDIDGNPTRLVLGAAWPDGAPVDDYGFAVFAFACVHCGTIRMMAADPVFTDGEDKGEADSH